MLFLKQNDPPAFRARVARLRAETGSAYSMWTDDQLADNIVEVCRRSIAEPTVARVYRLVRRGGGYRETML
jgi:hypothetical protein